MKKVSKAIQSTRKKTRFDSSRFSSNVFNLFYKFRELLELLGTFFAEL